MKILILGDATTAHIINWANSLNKEGIEIVIFSLESVDPGKYEKNIKIFFSSQYTYIKRKVTGSYAKIFYLLTVFKIKKIIKETKPDIVHAHYGSSYGLLGALSGFNPLLISIWGGDVIDFPTSSPIHREIFKFSLRKAKRILSTSPFMAELLGKYTSKYIDITPFGIDTKKFRSIDNLPNIIDEKVDCIIGTVKGLEWYYGIEYLIEAFSIVVKQLPEMKLKLLIVGGGSLEEKLRKLAKDKGVEKDTIFCGKVDYSEVYKYHNMLDIYVAVSVYEETFGVAVLEASACEKPVIISRVGGMKDVVKDGKTGFIVEPKDASQTASKIVTLIKNPQLRRDFGKLGRELVVENYELKMCVDKMINIYKDVIFDTLKK